ncbi:MAG: pantoate--beta-alanine ligase [Rikenellaceae bacterium]
MKIIDNVAQLRSEIDRLRSVGRLASEAGEASVVGFVPTMGALHEGHLTLVRSARATSDVVVVSIFVNPTQFNDPKDLEKYPRTLEADCKLLESVGADVVFAPTIEQIYPEPDTRKFEFGSVEATMEGASRPGHFNGVAQVVSRLFEIVQPTKSLFGEKDFQQVAIIKSMVEQLSIEVEIEVVPIVREADGLALSSRNVLLTQECREAAPAIYAALRAAQGLFQSMSPAELAAEVTRLVELSGVLKVIYFEAVDATTMLSVDSWSESESIQGCIAVQAGSVRLIDNIKLK